MGEIDQHGRACFGGRFAGPCRCDRLIRLIRRRRGTPGDCLLPAHIAIVKSPYDQLIRSGRKTVECRITRVACPPFGCISPSQRLYIKRSSGPFVATAEAARVVMVDQLTPRDVDQLKKRYDRWICGDEAFWKKCRDGARYATLIWLRNVRAISTGPSYQPLHMRAWYVIDDPGSPPGQKAMNRAAGCPDFVVSLTGGGIRNRYVTLTAVFDDLPRELLGRLKRVGDAVPVQLMLEGGRSIDTRIIRTGRRAARFAWRGWGEWFSRQQVQPGDRLEFIRQRPRSYHVRCCPEGVARDKPSKSQCTTT
jgi:hypothetical protein